MWVLAAFIPLSSLPETSSAVSGSRVSQLRPYSYISILIHDDLPLEVVDQSHQVSSMDDLDGLEPVASLGQTQWVGRGPGSALPARIST